MSQLATIIGSYTVYANGDVFQGGERVGHLADHRSTILGAMIEAGAQVHDLTVMLDKWTGSRYSTGTGPVAL